MPLELRPKGGKGKSALGRRQTVQGFRSLVHSSQKASVDIDWGIWKGLTCHDWTYGFVTTFDRGSNPVIGREVRENVVEKVTFKPQ